MDDTAFIDVYPVYFAKRGTAARRGQADAIDEEYNAILGQLPGGDFYGPSRLPVRPPTSALPHLAAERFGTWLLQTIQELAPEHVVTLGEEAWKTLDVLSVIGEHPWFPAVESTRSVYGTSGTLVVAGRELQWTPLAHPGAIRQSTNKPGSWGATHARWLAENSPTR
jgi:uracil-DNA glycosylase